MGNITGAMVFQSCIPTAIGVVLAAEAWTFSSDSLLSFARPASRSSSTIAIFLPMVRRGTLSGGHLLIGGLFYVVYVALVVAHWPACSRPFGPAVAARQLAAYTPRRC